MKLNVIGFVRAAACAGTLASLALLSSCGGGGTTQTFFANRVISFGDETSVINTDGSKYSVNGLLAGSTTLVDCTANPIWVQALASTYGLVFPQCPAPPGTSSAIIDPVSRIYAFNGALVADLGTQIDSALNNGGFTDQDMVTVLIGQNDVIQQFKQYPNVGEEQLLANLDAAGTALASQVNRIAALGPRVLISTIPYLGLAPFGGDRSPGSTDSNPALLNRLSTRFNDALLANLTNNGHEIGLIQLDQYLLTEDNLRIAGGGSYNNTTDPSCAVALPKCSTGTLTANAVGQVWLWADTLHLSQYGQQNLGSLATTVAFNNPF
jgi:outer membrane lipase/esterase